MGLRFRRRIKIAPGIHVNIGKKGTSISLGHPGATLNVGGKQGPRVTVGMPGTGLSYTANLSRTSSQAKRQDQIVHKTEGIAVLRFLGYGIVVLFLFLLVYGLFSR